jgi:outer membrane protein TolC
MQKPRLGVLTLLFGAGGVVAFAAGAAAETLTFDDVLARSRSYAFDVRFAEARVVEARGRVTGARALSQENPVVEALTGERRGEVETDETEIALTIPFGRLGLQRGPRVAMAEADLTREESNLADARRLAMGRAAEAFYRVLHARRLYAIAESRLVLADSLLAIARERERVGDVAQFDVKVAESEHGRAESDLLAQEGTVTGAAADLAKSIGLESVADLDVAGDLADQSGLDSLIDWGAAPERPDVMAAQAHVEMRAEESSLAGRERIPDFSLLGSSAREEGDEIVQGGAAITLPIFQRGQGSRGEARGRAELAQSERDATLAARNIESESAETMYRVATGALDRFEEVALPNALEYSSMATESYRAGRMDLPALLLIRREGLDAQREHADRQLERAVAAIELAVARGLFR